MAVNMGTVSGATGTFPTQLITGTPLVDQYGKPGCPNWNREDVTVYVWGTFGGGSVAVNISPDLVNWFPTGLVLTANGAQYVRAHFLGLQLVLTGGTGANLNAICM